MENHAVHRKVLVIEPDDLLRQLLYLWLTEAGYAVELRSSVQGESVTQPDLVVVNVPRATDLPAALNLMRTRYRVPMLAVSARFRRGLGGSEDAARRLGVRRVLPTPFSREELLQSIEDSLHT